MGRAQAHRRAAPTRRWRSGSRTSFGVPLTDPRLRRFPDGEINVKIEDSMRGHDVFVIQPTCPPVNEHLMELFIILDALRRASAGRVTAVVPYYGYARKERKTQPREPISAKLVANFITLAGADRLLLLDLHAEAIEGFFDVPTDHLSPHRIISEYLLTLGPAQPDTSSRPTPAAAAAPRRSPTSSRRPIAFGYKRRTGDDEVEMIAVSGDVKGRDCVVVEDIITTGGTISKLAAVAAQAGREQGAHRGHASGPHRRRDRAAEEGGRRRGHRDRLGPHPAREARARRSRCCRWHLCSLRRSSGCTRTGASASSSDSPSADDAQEWFEVIVSSSASSWPRSPAAPRQRSPRSAACACASSPSRAARPASILQRLRADPNRFLSTVLFTTRWRSSSPRPRPRSSPTSLFASWGVPPEWHLWLTLLVSLLLSVILLIARRGHAEDAGHPLRRARRAGRGRPGRPAGDASSARSCGR